YVHSHTSIIHKEDYLATVKLIVEVIKRLDTKTVNQITYL
ncbi:MAG TPA: peptidase M28, partial [Bacilli bacterium]|nr:peptidase M28 [Bacilli bacterium]